MYSLWLSWQVCPNVAATSEQISVMVGIHHLKVVFCQNLVGLVE